MKRLIYILALVLAMSSCSNESPALFGAAEVQSGSYANMLTLGDFLYVLGNGQLKTLSLIDPSKPELLDELNIDLTIESLFISGKNIFVGSPEGMFIYTIGDDGIPIFNSQTNYDDFELISCFSDPITANEEYAYVTLDNESNNESCFRPILEDGLRIYDIEDINNPRLVNSIFMNNPKGVALDGDYLFVGEKFNGLTVFELSNPENPTVIYKSENFEAFDLIPSNGILMVVGPDALHQFNYTDAQDSDHEIRTYKHYFYLNPGALISVPSGVQVGYEYHVFRNSYLDVQGGFLLFSKMPTFSDFAATNKSGMRYQASLKNHIGPRFFIGPTFLFKRVKMKEKMWMELYDGAYLRLFELERIRRTLAGGIEIGWEYKFDESPLLMELTYGFGLQNFKVRYNDVPENTSFEGFNRIGVNPGTFVYPFFNYNIKLKYPISFQTRAEKTSVSKSKRKNTRKR